MRSIVITLLILCSTSATAAKKTFLQIDPGGHKALIKDIVFTPDGRSLVSAGDDKLIRVWDIETGQTVRTLRGQIGAGHEGKIYAMALSPDGRWLAAGGFMAGTNTEKVGTIRLYDFSSGRLIALLSGHTNVVNALAFSPDSRILVSGSADFNAILWDVEQRRQLRTLQGHTDDIYAVAFTLDGGRVVTGSSDHTLRLWRVRDGKRIATLKGHTDEVVAIAISPQDGIIVSGSGESDDYSIRLWDGQTGRFIKTLAIQRTQVSSLSFSPDGRYLVSGVSKGKVCYVRSYPSGKRLLNYRGHDNIVLATAVSPDGRWAATGGGSNQEILIWSLPDGRLKQRLAGVGATTWAVGFSKEKEGQTLAWGKTYNQQGFHQNRLGRLEYSLALPTSQRPLGAPREVNLSVDFLRAQDQWRDWTLRTADQNAILEIYHQKVLKASIERSSSDGYDHRSYTFTPDGQSIISGGMNGVLSAYNREGSKIGDYVGHSGDVWAVAVSPDGRLLASASHDQTVRLWNVQSRENLFTLFHANNGEWVAWTPSGHYTASPNGDKMIGWQINLGADKVADYVTAAHLHQSLYRPDIVANAVRLGSVKQVLAQAGLTDFNLEQTIDETLKRNFAMWVIAFFILLSFLIILIFTKIFVMIIN
ncbi:MAG: WD40 repeat domain-containing protein [Pseudomonadota bacterium]